MQCWLVDICTSLEGTAILLYVVIYQSVQHNISEDLTIPKKLVVTSNFGRVIFYEISNSSECGGMTPKPKEST